MRLLLLNDPLTEPAVVPDGRLLQPRPHHQHRPQPQERGGLQPGLSVQGPVVGVSAGDHPDQEEHGDVPGLHRQVLLQVHQLAQLQQHGLDVVVLRQELQHASRLKGL